MNSCTDNHLRILYDSNNCPICSLREEFDLKLDDREDQDQINIFELFRRVRKIEKLLGINQKSHWWQPKNNDTPRTSAQPTPSEAQF